MIENAQAWPAQTQRECRCIMYSVSMNALEVLYESIDRRLVRRDPLMLRNALQHPVGHLIR